MPDDEPRLEPLPPPPRRPAAAAPPPPPAPPALDPGYYGHPGPPGYAPYGAPPPGYGTQTNGFAIASLVLGIVGGALCGVGAVLALIFGYKARGEIDRSRGRQSGQGMATAGIVLGWVWLVFVVLYVAFFVVMLATNRSGPGYQ